ncbi:unnamed protein product [Tilletia laevis]|uniref:Uncharacterized protein n=2 Tax=Tilletia TaxID=13289 RepID=A0A9N8M776_9BASI|nr:unnamed protein product [Tilletia controversa]CAD6960789.1 unnamed protein product [Tilletia laevis]CAD6960822.1 unnamed protein product [Tilletia laevis]
MVDEGLKVVFAKDTCRVTRPDRTCVATAAREEGQYKIHAREPLDLDAVLTGSTKPGTNPAAAQDTAERHRARPLLDLQEDMFDQQDMHSRDVAYARAILTKQQDPSFALLDFGLADSTGAAEQREYLQGKNKEIKVNDASKPEKDAIRTSCTHRNNPLGFPRIKEEGVGISNKYLTIKDLDNRSNTAYSHTALTFIY